MKAYEEILSDFMRLLARLRVIDAWQINAFDKEFKIEGLVIRGKQIGEINEDLWY